MNIVEKAGCVIVNVQEEKIALVIRDGEYSFPKGHLEKGETIKECAERETVEETGHDVKIVGDELCLVKYETPDGESVENHMFLGLDMGLTNKFVDEKDKEKTEWFEIDEIEEKLSYQNLKDVWKEIKPKVEKVIKE